MLSTCDRGRGTSPFLVIAPHGGRRSTGKALPPGRPARVNDLHTADLALDLADRLKASWVINRELDRNELDLNRISQVTRHAPWFLEIIGDLLHAILDRHPAAEVLFIHGWNVIQARCDIGIGATLSDEEASGAHAPALSVSPRYVHQRLRRLRHLCESAGIRATYGLRYPAAHPNNLLQVFRRAARAPSSEAAARLTAWAAADRVHAVQLELGVPVRWPGLCRERFADVIENAFVPTPLDPTPPADAFAQPTTRELTPPVTMQVYDPRCRMGLVARLLAAPDGSGVGARLLVLPDSQRAALFTGEDRSTHRAAYEIATFCPDSNGVRFRFSGSLLEVDDARRYLDLEDAFAASRLIRAEIDLSFRPSALPDYGHIEGRVVVEGRAAHFDTHGFVERVSLPRSPGPSGSRVDLAAAFGPDLALRWRGRPGGTGSAAKSSGVAAVIVSLHDDGCTPRGFELALDSGARAVGEPISAMPIRQPGAAGGTTHVTLGTARFACSSGRIGFGLYEYARAIAAPPR